jgi:hypothetical protein
MSNNIMMKQPYNGDVPIGQLAKAIALVLAGGLLFGPASALATPLAPVGNFIANGGYGTDATPSLASWVKAVTGTGTSLTNINARASGDVINTGLGNTGFSGNSFTSAFAVLGDDSGAIATGDVPNSGVFTLSQNFSLAATHNGFTVLTYDLDFVFTAVLDGLDSSSTSNNDVFSAKVIDVDTLDEYALISRDSNGLRTTNFTTVGSIPQFFLGGAVPFSVSLAPGNYKLEFKLNEISGTLTNLTNTAVGIDNVSVSGVMLTPEPGLLSLLGVGLGALGWSRRRSA